MSRHASFPLRSSSVVASILASATTVGFATYATWRVLDRHSFGIDDANIFFIYARHFVQGHGIVYSVGGAHVEGFTSMLYFLICSLVFELTSRPETVLLWVNLLFTILASACLLHVLNLLAERLGLGDGGKLLLSACYLIWILANPAYFAWTVVTLMDSGIYSFALTIGYAFIAALLLSGALVNRRTAIELGVLCSLCILARPEGLAWAILQAFSFACICWGQTRSLRSTLRLASLPLAAILLVSAGLTAFRELYFGYPLPNTFYAKVSSSLYDTLDGGFNGYGLRTFLHLYGIVILLPLAVAIIWTAYVLLRSRKRDTLFWFGAFTALFTITGIAIPIAEGGDNFGACRLFQNIYPLLGVSLLLPLLPFAKARKLSLDATYLALLGVTIALTSHATWRAFWIANHPSLDTLPPHAIERRLDISDDFLLADYGRDAGERMDRIFQGGLPSIGLAAAGGMAYTYTGTSDDLLGLNDIRIAHADKIKTGPKGHASFDLKLFDDISPDIFQPWVVPTSATLDLQTRKYQNLQPGDFDNEIFKGLFSEQQFRSTYILAAVRNPADPADVACGYFRKAYLDDLIKKRGLQLVHSVEL